MYQLINNNKLFFFGLILKMTPIFLFQTFLAKFADVSLPPGKWRLSLVTLGAPWTFVVNGQPEFIRGANWVPADAIPARLWRDDYAALLQLAHSDGEYSSSATCPQIAPSGPRTIR